jgi:hypothetical protein
MKSSDEPEFLVGCTAITAFVNRVLRPAKLYQHRVYRLIEKQRLPAGSSSHRPVAIGVKGEIPAPAPGEQFDSLIEAPVGRHSQKPMIETLHPHLPRLEMFTWQHRAGWEVRGNEAEREAAE